MSLRSYNGCARCKRRRQKCDERKPSCLRCTEAGVTCEYLITLKWDGRIPRRQEASRRQRRDVTELDSDIEIVKPQLHELKSPVAENPGHLFQQDIPEFCQLDVLISWTPAEKLLLDHYMTTTSMIASHTQLRDQICHQILPMALQIPSLMYATLALSALHRLTLLNGVPDGFVPEAMISDLMSRSLKHLREELQNNDPRSRYLSLHTIRTLCVYEIYSGKADSSWRVHVDGARMIFHSMKPIDDHPGSNEHSWLSSRWYSSMEALTSLTDRGILNCVKHERESLSVDNENMSLHDSCLDIYMGYSSDLNTVFKDIGILAKRRRSIAKTSPQLVECFHTRVRRLESTIKGMIRRDIEEGLKIPPNVSLQRDKLKQFKACNVAYQHSALLHVYRRLQKRETCSIEIQTSVSKILEVVCGILPMEALSPWALLTTPIFTAGCEALGEHRILVRRLLLDLYKTLRIRNILRAIVILDQRWARPMREYENGLTDAPVSCPRLLNRSQSLTTI